ncbi:hypothetical protein CSKR_102713 [Clonorchis sinensis]|uniref:Uncharacterized protein n=1 Tax=Clonorchis sinensis TaxID=79923 RepID=A0A8T1MP21_CLOSI|nr:hypothetical protein CSKR_102713 [Clonorchis sinensis]
MENYTSIFQERNPCRKLLPEIQANSAFIDRTPITCLASLEPCAESDHENIYLMISRDQLPTKDAASGSLDKLAKQVEDLLPHNAFSVEGVFLKVPLEEMSYWPREFAGPFPVILDAYQEVDNRIFTVVRILASVVNDRMPEMNTQDLTQMELWLFAKHQRLRGLYLVERGGRCIQEHHQVIPFYFHFERNTQGPQELSEQTKPVIKDISRATRNSRISVLLSKYEQKCLVTEEPRPVAVWFGTVQLYFENQKKSVKKLAAGEKEINSKLVELTRQKVTDRLGTMGLRSTIITVTVDYLYTDGINQISAAIHIYHNLIEFNQKVFVTGPQELEVKLQQTICKSSAESAGILRWENMGHQRVGLASGFSFPTLVTRHAFLGPVLSNNRVTSCSSWHALACLWKQCGTFLPNHTLSFFSQCRNNGPVELRGLMGQFKVLSESTSRHHQTEPVKKCLLLWKQRTLTTIQTKKCNPTNLVHFLFSLPLLTSTVLAASTKALMMGLLHHENLLVLTVLNTEQTTQDEAESWE